MGMRDSWARIVLHRQRWRRPPDWARWYAALVLVFAVAAGVLTFTIVDTVVLRGVPFSNGDRLMVLEGQGLFRTYSEAAYRSWSRRLTSFESIGASYVGPLMLIDAPNGTSRVRGWRVTASLFDVLLARPIAGRPLTESDQRLGQHQVAVISHDMWRRFFGGDEKVLGRRVRLAASGALPAGTTSVEIVGVMPPGFRYPLDAEVGFWMPHVDSDRRGAYLSVVGRLRAGIEPPAAQAELDAVNAGLNDLPSLISPNHRPRVMPMQDAIVGDVRNWMLLTLLAVSFVVLHAYISAGTLLLVRATRRNHALALQAAVGASPGQLALTSLTEGLLISIIASAVGIGLAVVALGATVAAMPPELARVVRDVAVDGRVLAVAGVVAVIGGLTMAVLPARQAFDTGRMPQPSAEPRQSGSRKQRRRLETILSAQVAAVTVLMVGVTLVVESFVRVANADLGFEPSGLLTLELPQANAGDALERALLAVPEIDAVARQAGGSPPLMAQTFGGQSGSTTFRPSADVNGTGQPVEVSLRRVSPEYFAAMGISIRQGRTFEQNAGRGAEAIVDEVAAAHLIPSDRDALTASIRQSPDGAPMAVVGIVGAIRDAGPFRPPTPHVYVPLNDVEQSVEVIVRTDLPSHRVADVVRAAIAEDPGAGSPVIRSVDDALAAITAGSRFNGTVMATFGLVALLVGGGAVYAVTSVSASQRRKELAVRAALGASRWRLLAPVVGQSLRCLAVGLLVGLPIGRAVARLLDRELYAISSGDVHVYAIVAAVMFGSTACAAIVPAWRAATVCPFRELNRG